MPIKNYMPTEQWEKEFDSKLASIKLLDRIDWQRWVISQRTIPELKDFISKLLSQTRQDTINECAKVVESMRIHIPEGETGTKHVEFPRELVAQAIKELN